MPPISSLQNDRVKLIRALQTQGKTRRAEQRIALEGARLVGAALTSGTRPDFVFYTADAQSGERESASLLTRLQDEGIAAVEVTPEIMAHISDTQSPQGVIAVAPMPDLVMPLEPNLILILDGVADPGNLGTILRTAAAASVSGVVLAPRSVDPYNPKVLRSAMGAHFRIPVLRQRWAEIAQDYAGLTVYLAEAEAATPYYAVDWTAPAAVIIGGEARGAAEEARQLAQSSVAIPMSNAVESINAAIAAGVILFEIRRQRATMQTSP